MKKVCTKCSIEKEVTEFYKNKQIKCGYDSWCKKCQLKKKRKYQKKSPKTIEREKLLLENKKRCTQCDNIKEVTEFNKYNKSKSGYSSWCKKCKKEKYYNYSSNRQYNYQKCDKTLEREELLNDNKKRCTKCDDIKSLDHFSKNKQVKFGYNSWCKKCHNDKRRENYNNEHQIKKQINPEYYSLREERKQLLQQGKYKCYSCKDIKEVSKFNKIGKYYQYCLDCCNEERKQKRILKNLSKDPYYYIKKEKKLEEKNKKLEEKDLLLTEGKKECRKCNKVLPIVSFETIGKHNCISCHKAQKKINETKSSKRKKRRMKNDPEFRKRENERRSIRDRKRRLTDDEWRIYSNKRKRERYKERMKDPEYRKAHNKRSEKRRKERRNTDPIYAMKKRVSTRIRNYMARCGYEKKTRTHEILGIDWPGFKEHIERQFINGMTWENRDRWHIDHIIPMDSADCEADVIRLNHYTNLQPLWAKDNLSKGSKIL